jgi:hypothetical protein
MVPQVADVPASHFASTPTIRESTMIVFLISVLVVLQKEPQLGQEVSSSLPHEATTCSEAEETTSSLLYDLMFEQPTAHEDN